MDCRSLTDPDPTRNPAPLPGSLGDLVARAHGQPIYCTPSLAVRRPLMNVVVNTLRRDFPAAAFVDALALYRNYNDWDRRWPSEREHYGAVIIVTRAEDLLQGSEPFAGVTGKHDIGFRLFMEVDDCVRSARPVAWHAVVFPASYWLSRFVVVPFRRICMSRFARLAPADGAETFCPLIGQPFFRIVPA